MKITQATVDRIIARAKASDFGLGDGLTHKQGHNQIDQYAERDLKALGTLLVNGYDAKYDLISVFIAALEIVAEDTMAATPGKQRACLENVFAHLGREIQRMRLNESAETGTQKLSAEVAAVLDGK